MVAKMNNSKNFKASLGEVFYFALPSGVTVAAMGLGESPTLENLRNQIAGFYKSVKEKYAGNIPSLITFATGPSRTADIEKTLVTGVHGPKEVYCFLIEA